ncbi:MAG: rRNA maturation RNase YbeY [Candidatus Saccharimonas sp.]|nr:rRNA maturation RNase YbeY [Planctomycetaceae bacterium]
MNEFSIDIADRQTCLVLDEPRLREAVVRVLTEERVHAANISLALVDDAEIHRVNREFLGHDYPTDVISFRLDENGGQKSEVRSQKSEAGGHQAVEPPNDSSFLPPSSFLLHPSLEGELIVSTETALREAAAHGWSPQDEVMLYLVHGLLHLCGYDDLTDEARPAMRVRERDILAGWQLIPTGLEA